MHVPDLRRHRAVGPGLLFAIFCGLAYGQKPIVYPGGVVNGASFVKKGQPGFGLAQGSIASIFGENLASATASAQGLPLPKTLAGTSVTINGLPAPLFYVSPGQLNVQVPAAATGNPLFLGRRSLPVVVTTAAGASEPATVEMLGKAAGVFTLDGTGCGPPALFNYHADGSMSLNSPSNSISPGGLMIIYGTGLGHAWNQPPDGEPAPFNPLAQHSEPGGVAINGRVAFYTYFSGRTPGLVGVDQVNFALPADMAEGCSLPMVIGGYPTISQPVRASVRKGGGECIDPPPDSLGTIHWERVVLASGIDPPPKSDTVQIEFASAIGKRFPESVARCSIVRIPPAPSVAALCPGFEGTALDETTLDAGVLTLQGSALSPLQTMPRGVNGKLAYQVELPPGAIQEGALRVAGSGSAGVGTFETSVRLPAPIRITSSLSPGTRIPSNQNLTVTWSGGDAESIVRMRLIARAKDIFYPDIELERYCEAAAPATDGKVTLTTIDCSAGGNRLRCLPVFPTSTGWEVLITVMPKDPQAGQFSAQGLTLGGRHTWAYRYRFGKLTN